MLTCGQFIQAGFKQAMTFQSHDAVVVPLKKKKQRRGSGQHPDAALARRPRHRLKNDGWDDSPKDLVILIFGLIIGRCINHGFV